MKQLALPEPDDTDERFAEFHSANPAVYAELVRLARELRASGHRRLGIRMLWEVLRWQRMLDIEAGVSPYKLNDHYVPYYARLIMATEPDLVGIFEIRALGRERDHAT